jgi:uncharacterized membrane protein
MSMEQQSNVFVSDRHQNPSVIMAAQPKEENFTWAAVVACISTVLFITLLIMQWLDLQALDFA